MKTLLKYKGKLYIKARTVHDLTEDYLKVMKADDWVRVFHGTAVLTGARLKPQDMVFGIDALGEEATSKYHPNTPGFHRYSGIYVAPTLKEAGRWGSLIFEVAVKARNLHPTNWSAKLYKSWDAEDKEMFDRHCKAEYPNSFNPVLSGALSTNYDNCASGVRGHEPQALFKGITKARDILAVHYYGEALTPQEFLKKFSKDVSYYEESYKSKGPDPKSTTLSLDEYLSIVTEHVDKDPKDFFSIISRYWAIDGEDEALRLIKQLAPFSVASAKRFLKLLSEKYCDVLVETWERIRSKRPDLNLGDPPSCQQRAASVKYKGQLYRLADPVLLEPPKEKETYKDPFRFHDWVDLTADDLRDDPELLQVLYDLIIKAYEGLEGGHSSIGTPLSLLRDDLILHAIDLDNDPEPDAVVTWKIRQPGSKVNSFGHDGGSAAKRTVVQEFGRLLQSTGYYAEVSPPVSDIVWKRWPNVQVIENPAVVAAIVGKDIEWLGKNPDGKSPKEGWYSRNIGGKPHIKILVGFPRGVTPKKASFTNLHIKYKGHKYVRADLYKLDSVEFLSEKEMKELTPSPLFGMISITDPGRRATLPEGWGSVLRLQFDDIEEAEPFRPYGGSKDWPFDKHDAKRIIDWLEENKGKLAGIYVHCWGGISRSAAVAKFIAEKYNLPFDHSYDKYNKLVYETLWSV